MTIKLKDTIGEICTDYDRGINVSSIAEERLSRGEHLVIDLDGVRFTSLSFFNGAVGELVLKFDLDFLKSHIDFVNITPSDKSLLSKSIAFARKLKSEESPVQY